MEKDIVAARTFYECAANLGDTDAMNEVARLYEEGKGGKKDRVSAFVFVFWEERARVIVLSGLSCGSGHTT